MLEFPGDFPLHRQVRIDAAPLLLASILLDTNYFAVQSICRFIVRASVS